MKSAPGSTEFECTQLKAADADTCADDAILPYEIPPTNRRSCSSFVAVATAAGPPIELELVTERGVQITAPQEWLQLLAGIGIEHVQIRGSRQGDEPKVDEPRQRKGRQLPGRRHPHIDETSCGSPAARSPEPTALS